MSTSKDFSNEILQRQAKAISEFIAEADRYTNAVHEAEQNRGSQFAKLHNYINLRRSKLLSQLKEVNDLLEKARQLLFGNKEFASHTNWLEIPSVAPRPDHKVDENFQAATSAASESFQTFTVAYSSALNWQRQQKILRTVFIVTLLLFFMIFIGILCVFEAIHIQNTQATQTQIVQEARTQTAQERAHDTYVAEMATSESATQTSIYYHYIMTINAGYSHATGTAAYFTRISRPSKTPTKTPTTITTAATVDRITCAGAPPIRVEKGDTVEVIDTYMQNLDRYGRPFIPLRSDPLVGENVVLYLYDGMMLLVLEGPECANNVSFFRVEVLSVKYNSDSYIGFRGWVAESEPYVKNYYLEVLP